MTPIGIAIGLGVGSSYNANGEVALGFEGAFNSVSAGQLLSAMLYGFLLISSELWWVIPSYPKNNLNVQAF